jgi:hypothetical protein
MKDEILALFTDILLVCEEEKLLGGTFFALDGCKLSSNASKRWSGKISDIKKKKEKIEQKVKGLLEEQIEVDRNDSAIVEPIYANIRTHKRLDRFTLILKRQGKCFS